MIRQNSFIHPFMFQERRKNALSKKRINRTKDFDSPWFRRKRTESLYVQRIRLSRLFVDPSERYTNFRDYMINIMEKGRIREWPWIDPVTKCDADMAEIMKGKPTHSIAIRLGIEAPNGFRVATHKPEFHAGLPTILPK